ncbi:hypothetical protein FIV42_21080 [Persicimonas caeni]|uniref:Uncharacterized protein n=1 Tax=Persicimonas caeni TaxID=2292766 RepID=A0A4Y6PZG7_PERCE|nr:hypothetical protein [Persicimonas caeni]QDG53145.1 hypothetical protein FIV42_21080 [Persicimonas caeni]QED34367.1 hypothetical protein FRD00_21075 [Persicimonas caeni]
MSENEEELNDDELNSLLADLESRADSGGGGGASSADDDEDLEAFLARLESEESSSGGAQTGGAKKVATKEKDDDLDARFAELDNLQPDDLPAKTPDKKSKKAKKRSKKSKKGEESTELAKSDAEAGEEGEKAPSKGAVVAKVAAKWLLMALPVIVLTWVVGAFLANWVSAGWLIAAVALVFALGVPALASHFVKKGKFAWWAAGAGVLLTVALTAPMPQTAGETLVRYGHWPASAVSELAGWETDNTLVGINSTVASWLGGLLYSGEVAPAELGTDHPLDPDAAPESAETPTEP